MKALGDRDRVHQYDDYVIPITDEEKIAITQKYHMKAQKDLNKAMKLINKAIKHYSESHYGSEKVLERLAKHKRILLDMKEQIKKDTYNALPYKELEQEMVKESEIMDSYPNRFRLTKRKVIAGAVATFLLFTVAGIYFDDELARGIILPIGVVGLLALTGYFVYIWKKIKSTRTSLTNDKEKVW